MAIFRMIRRKGLLNGGVKNSELINLFQRCDYFRNRKGETSIYLEFDVLLIFLALDLLEFFPLRNVSQIVNDLAKFYPNLYRLLKQNQKQFLVVEKQTNTEMVIEMSFYVVSPMLIDSLKVLDWGNRGTMVLLNLEKIYLQVENLFAKEGIIISTGDAE